MKRFLLGVLVLLSCALCPLPPAAAQAAAAQGWWSALHRQGLPALPAPPDVGPTDLLVEGGDLLAELPGLPEGQPRPLAVAALRFVVDPGSTVSSLDLQVKGTAIATGVRAYSTAAPFEPVQNGAYELAPDVVLNQMTPGLLSADSTVLSFPDIAQLVRPDGVLSIVLIGGVTDRAVLAAPGAGALSVVAAREPRPPLPDPTVARPAPVEVAPPVTAPAFSPLPPVVRVPPVVQAPVVPAPQAVAPVVGRKAAAADDGTTRLLVLLEGLLVVVYFGLLGYGPLGRLSRWTGLTTTARGAQVARGVGRFSAVRSGTAPRL